jgi:hypothetical protein
MYIHWYGWFHFTKDLYSIQEKCTIQILDFTYKIKKKTWCKWWTYCFDEIEFVGNFLFVGGALDEYILVPAGALLATGVSLILLLQPYQWLYIYDLTSVLDVRTIHDYVFKLNKN